MSLPQNYLSKPFSHIYVENKVKENSIAKTICTRFSGSNIIEINHYKDIFTPSGQSLLLTKHAPSLILAKKEGTLIYKGAPVCENFGNDYFYYTSLVMNCFYDCEYCYLSGMYPSANIVMFVNIEDIFFELDKLLRLHPVYVCISYDTDLLALEGLTGYVKRFIEFTASRPNLTVECRTKSANINIIKKYIENGLSVPQNFILAWTLSPQEIAEKFEHGTPDFKSRLSAINVAAELNLSLRLCLDPILKIKSFKTAYSNMISTIFNNITPDRLKDISVGAFRVSKDYLSRMRKKRGNSALLYYPYLLENGVYSYGNSQNRELTEFIISLLCKHVDRNKIFTWE